MAVVCPTVTPENLRQFRHQIERIVPYAKRIHLDFMDGQFTPVKSPDIDDIPWPGGNLKIDVHLMHRQPDKALDRLIKLKPNLVIVHAEADGNFVTVAQRLHEVGISAGIALLPDTPVNAIKPAIEHIDHVLIFSGNLGHFGGVVDLGLLEKVKQCKSLKSGLEIGWDGGITDANIKQLASGGVDVLNVGGYIQRAEKPHERFGVLQNLLH